MALLKVMNPIGETNTEESFQGGASMKDLTGKTVGLFWNGKHNGDVFLLKVVEILKERFKGMKIEKFDYGFEGVGDHAIREMADKSDFVLGAMAD